MTYGRRAFLQTCLLVSGGAIFPVSVFAAKELSPRAAPGLQAYEINDWIRLEPSGRVILGLSQIEVGQGVYTTLPQILADELDADWENISVEFVTGRPAYRFEAAGVSLQQFVGGSTSTFIFYDRLRRAGAHARECLRRAAAVKTGSNLVNFRTSNGRVIDTSTGKSYGYGELIEYLPKVKVEEDVPFEPKGSNTLIGRELKRLDTPDKVAGKTVFGIDVQQPGMLLGAVRMAPTLTGKVSKIRNAEQIERRKGVKAVVNAGDAAIVVATSYWVAKKACDELEIDWAPGDPSVDSAAIRRQLDQALEQKDAIKVADTRPGNKDRSVEAASTLEATYYSPYIVHATLEPVVCTAHVHKDKIEVWGPIQGQDFARLVLGKRFGLPPEKVMVHTTFAGGSFGRKYVPDYIVHAAVASAKVGVPVKVIRSREDDLRHGFYRPSALGRFRASFDDKGALGGLHCRMVGQSLYYAISKAKFEKWGFDPTMADGISNMPYNIPNVLVEQVNVPQRIPISFMRGIGLTSAVFAFESFLNEIAHARHVDPVELRRAMLKDDPVSLAVIDATARKFGWNDPLPRGTYKGFAFYRCIARGEIYTTYAAIAVALRIGEHGECRLERIVCGVDCGLPINPNIIRSTIEAGMAFGMTNTFYSEITFKDGAVEAGNFDRYRLVSLNQMPAVESVIINSERPPQGLGEHPLPPLAPAIADALFRATGKRHRSLPLPVTLGDRVTLA